MAEVTVGVGNKEARTLFHLSISVIQIILMKHLTIDGDQIVIPVWQPLVKCEENTQEMIVIQKELFTLAANGDLLIEYNALMAIICDRLTI